MGSRLEKILHGLHKNFTCVYCGVPANAMHHVLVKKTCLLLRYEPDNLMPVCITHHNMVHNGLELPKIWQDKREKIRPLFRKSLKQYLVENGLTQELWESEQKIKMENYGGKNGK